MHGEIRSRNIVEVCGTNYSPFLRRDRKSYQVPDALSVSALPQKTRISWLSAALWGNDYFVFDVRRHAVLNLQSSACMAPDSVLTAVQYLWQVHYIKLTLQSRLRAQCDFLGALIAVALQSVRAFRVSGGDIFYLWYTRSGPWRTSWCVGVW